MDITALKKRKIDAYTVDTIMYYNKKTLCKCSYCYYFVVVLNILSHGFILLTFAIETDNPQSEDVNSTELNITCCHLGITVNTIWRECSIRLQHYC